MADTKAEASTEEQMQNLHLDEVTGERVSKTELKRRQKQREKDDKKKEKVASAPAKPGPPKMASAEENEAQLNPNVGNPLISEESYVEPVANPFKAIL